MDNSYLFFDIECANCFDGQGKMCSFGYVLTDSEFNVLDCKDIVMNPDAEFDWYLFSPKNKCPLAYSKDYFRSKPNFANYYKSIRELLTAPFRRVIGFSAANDVNFVISACERYDLPLINFAAYDSEIILNKVNNVHRGLEDWASFYEVDVSGLRAHRSCDDAMMTMLAVKALSAAQHKSLEQLLAHNKDSHLSVEKLMERRREKEHREELTKKIKELYGKKSRCSIDVLKGGVFGIGFKIQKDIDTAYDIASLVYKNGGILRRNIKDSGTIIMEDSSVTSANVEKMSKSGLNVISITDFYAMVKR